MINWVNERYPTDIARGGIWITENGISLEEKFADVDRYQNIYLHFNEVGFSNCYSLFSFFDLLEIFIYCKSF